MSILTRAKQLIFGDGAASGEFGVIGSKAAGSPVTSKDIETIQGNSLYLNGLFSITSDQGTSRLPYTEDINSLFYLTTSQLAYLFQNGIPEYNADTDYYEGISFVQDEGMVWVSLEGDALTPNTGNKPSLNLDKWAPVCAPTKQQDLSDADSVTVGYEHIKGVIDVSLGDATLGAAIPVPKFLGQKGHFIAEGTGIAEIPGGNGLYANSVFITENTGGLHIEAVDDGAGGLEWSAINEVTADYYSGNTEVKQWSNGFMTLESDGSGTSVTISSAIGSVFYNPATSVVFAVSFSSTPIVHPICNNSSSVRTWAGRSSNITTTGADLSYFGATTGVTARSSYIARGEY